MFDRRDAGWVPSTPGPISFKEFKELCKLSKTCHLGGVPESSSSWRESLEMLWVLEFENSKGKGNFSSGWKFKILAKEYGIY